MHCKEVVRSEKAKIGHKTRSAKHNILAPFQHHSLIGNTSSLQFV